MYQAKTLVSGYKLGKQFAGKSLVAVPEKHNKNGAVIAFKDKQIIINDNQSFVTKKQFPDKFGRGFYTLVYYELED